MAAEPIDTVEAARRLKLEPRTVQHLCKTGVLPARQFGRVYLIDPADLAKARKRRPRGRPPKNGK